MTENDKIIDKIQKLLSLATSSNENEAGLAAKKATELLTKYNLSLQDIDVQHRNYDVMDFEGTGPRQSMVQKYAFSILNEFFFIQVVTGQKRVYCVEKGRMSSKAATWQFFGQKHNVQIASHIYVFLTRTFDELFEVYALSSGNTSKNDRNSFYMGLYQGLRLKLSESKRAAQNETGLVVVKDPYIDDFIKSSVGKTVAKSSAKVHINSEARNSGVEQGKNIRIAVGVNAKNDSSIKYLK